MEQTIKQNRKKQLENEISNFHQIKYDKQAELESWYSELANNDRTSELESEIQEIEELIIKKQDELDELLIVIDESETLTMDQMESLENYNLDQKNFMNEV